MGLEIKNLVKRYGSKLIFDNFNLSLPNTGVFAIMGESGAGKTTLLRLISGLDTDFSGEIIGGGMINCSFAFQEYRLFPVLSALDNLIFAVSDKRDEKIIKEAKDLLFSLGFAEEDLDKLPSSLSGGMKQRVSIGRSILKKAPILLLDEPTKELDADNVSLVLDLLKKESKERLLIIVTHRIEDCLKLGAEIINI